MGRTVIIPYTCLFSINFQVVRYTPEKKCSTIPWVSGQTFNSQCFQ